MRYGHFERFVYTPSRKRACTGASLRAAVVRVVADTRGPDGAGAGVRRVIPREHGGGRSAAWLV